MTQEPQEAVLEYMLGSNAAEEVEQRQDKKGS